MARLALTATQHKQRWLRAFVRIASNDGSNGKASFSSDRKRSRTLSSTISLPRNMIFSAISDPSTVAGFGYRYQSSESSTRTFRNPLHRDPSRISSSVGSIYRPPNYLLGLDNDPVMLPADNHLVADSIRSCIKIDEDEPSENETSTNDKSLTTELSICFLGTGAGSPANVRSTSCTLLKLSLIIKC